MIGELPDVARSQTALGEGQVLEVSRGPAGDSSISVIPFFSVCRTRRRATGQTRPQRLDADGGVEHVGRVGDGETAACECLLIRVAAGRELDHRTEGVLPPGVGLEQVKTAGQLVDGHERPTVRERHAVHGPKGATAASQHGHDAEVDPVPHEDQGDEVGCGHGRSGVQPRPGVEGGDRLTERAHAAVQRSSCPATSSRRAVACPVVRRRGMGIMSARLCTEAPRPERRPGTGVGPFRSRRHQYAPRPPTTVLTVRARIEMSSRAPVLGVVAGRA